jgi:hypothetical protein
MEPDQAQVSGPATGCDRPDVLRAVRPEVRSPKRVAKGRGTSGTDQHAGSRDGRERPIHGFADCLQLRPFPAETHGQPDASTPPHIGKVPVCAGDWRRGRRGHGLDAADELVVAGVSMFSGRRRRRTRDCGSSRCRSPWSCRGMGGVTRAAATGHQYGGDQRSRNGRSPGQGRHVNQTAQRPARLVVR